MTVKTSVIWFMLTLILTFLCSAAAVNWWSEQHNEHFVFDKLISVPVFFTSLLASILAFAIGCVDASKGK